MDDCENDMFGEFSLNSIIGDSPLPIGEIQIAYRDCASLFGLPMMDLSDAEYDPASPAGRFVRIVLTHTEWALQRQSEELDRIAWKTALHCGVRLACLQRWLENQFPENRLQATLWSEKILEERMDLAAKLFAAHTPDVVNPILNYIRDLVELDCD